jgi:RNA polymerase sigma factor (sigma-70 family)
MEGELILQLFRQEFSKMVAVISKLFGLQHIEIAEDIVSETFLQASQNWSKDKIPPNPTAWLYAVAKQKTLYHFRRSKIFNERVVPQYTVAQPSSVALPEPDFSEQNIQDSQLQMIFAICNPVIASEAQIGLALRILCGFGIDEIADAFLSNKETINKRLFRAREKLRTEKVRLEMPLENEIANRLDNVLHIIYLLFNEGYYSTSHNQVLRKDLCLEALRLALILTEYKNTNIPKTNALIALMCFHTSRYDARQNNENSIILYEHQNEQLWNKDLINKGNHYLALSANGNEISSYHLEAGIAFWHCQKEETVEKWNRILEHYNMLLEINYSRTVALNRIYAIYKAKGSEIALEEAEKLQFTSSHFYYTLLGELYKEVDTNSALLNYEKAFSMAKTQVDKQLLKSKIENIKINF